MTVLIIFLVVLLIVSVLLIIMNKHEEKIAQIGVKILVVTIITAFILIIFEIFSPLPIDNKTVDVLILCNKEKIDVKNFFDRLLKVGSPHRKGYELLTAVDLFFPKNDKLEIDLEAQSLDSLEMAFWLWLAKKYSIHWDVESEYFEGISGGSGSSGQSKDAEKNPVEFSPEELQKLLHDNTYLVSKGQLWKIMLPSGTSLSVIERSKCRRGFRIKNDYINFKIDIHKVGDSGLLYTTLGENIRKTLSSPDSWYSHNFKVKFECAYTKWFRGSLRTKKQKKWVNEIMNDFYNDFEWNLVKSDLERAYSDKN